MRRHDLVRTLGAFRPVAPPDPGDPDPPPGASIFNVSVDQVDQTSAVVTWDASPPLTGYVEYGTTTAYGQETVHAVNLWPSHVQAISGLAPNTTYHFRVSGWTEAGESGQFVQTGDFTFTTLPSSPAPGGTGTTYGPAMNSDSKDNYRLRGTAEANAQRLLGIRWRPTTTSQLVAIALPFRWANNGSYSDNYPNWGNVRLRIMTETAGRPNFANVLATEVYVPATQLNLSGVSTGIGELYYPVPISPSPTLTAGVAYYCIIDNNHPGATAGGAQSISINTNHIWQSGYGSGLARPFGTAQPKWDPDDFALVTPAGGGFLNGANVSGFSIPICDIVYANGVVDGWTTPHNVSFPFVRDIGGNDMVRERFVAQQAVEVASLWARVGRWSGSGNLTIELRLANGTVIAGGAAAGSGSTTTFWDRQDATSPNGSWVEVPVTPVTLSVGTTYDLVLSAPSGTTYGMVPILWRSSAMVNYAVQSEHFEEGSGQYSTNGGSSWQNMHNFPSHAQVFMELT